MDTQWWRTRALVLTAAFTLLASVATLTASWFSTADGVPVWSPVAAIVLVYLLKAPRWGVAVATSTLLVVGLLTAGDTSPTVQVLSVLTLVGTYAGAAELLGRVHETHDPRSPFAMLATVTIGGFAAPVVAATTSRLAAAIATSRPFDGLLEEVLAYALSDAVGIIALAPVLLWATNGRPELSWDDDVQRIALPTAVVSVVLGSTVVFLPGANDPVFLIMIPLTIVAVWGGAGWYAITLAGTAIGLTMTLDTVAATEAATVSASRLVLWTVGATAIMVAASADDRRRAGGDLRKSTDQANSLFDRTATPTCMVDPDTVAFVRANSAMVGLVGMDSASIVATDPGDLFNIEPGQHLPDMVREGGEYEVIVNGAEGPRTGRFVISSIEDTTTGRPLALVQFIDLTSMRDHATTLEQSNESLAGFAHRVSHDLKTPLVALHGFAMLLARRDTLPEATQDDLIQRIERGAKRVMEQLEEMLVSARSMSETPRPVDFQELANWLCEVNSLVIEQSGGEISVELHTDQAVLAASALRQILLNLVSNAFKYHHADRPPVVRVSSKQTADGVLFRVDDNGLGIPVGQLEAVFTSGMRLTPDVAPGDGSGLTTSRRLAEAQGGKLLAVPSEEGASFVLHLPTVEADTPTRVKSKKSRAAAE